MGTSVQCVIQLVVLFATVFYGRCALEFPELLEISDSLDEMMGIVKKPKQVDSGSWIWQDYEAGSGFGNREELLIKHIEIWQDPSVPEHIDNWQYLKQEDGVYFAGASNSTFSLYHLNTEYNSTSLVASISTPGTIEIFKIISVGSGTLRSKSDVYVILCERVNDYMHLKWYQSFDGVFVNFWIWKFGKPVKSLEYFNVDGRHKLLLLYANDVYFNQTLSAIEIYDIKLNGYFSTHHLCQQIFVPDAIRTQVCVSQYDKTVISLISRNSIILYEYKDEEMVMCSFKKVQNILNDGIVNTMCFESGYMNYLAIAGNTSNLYIYQTNDFVIDDKMKKSLFEVGDIDYVQSLSLQTYREETALFFRLKNSSVLAFGWQGTDGFQLIPLANKGLDSFDLSKATVIPNYGFLIGNTFIKCNFELRQLSKPGRSDVQKMLEIKNIFDDILDKRELIAIKNKLSVEEKIIDNVELNKLSESAEIIVDNLTMGVTDGSLFKVGSDEFYFEELQSTLEKLNKSISALEIKAEEIEEIVRKIADVKSTKDHYFDVIDITGEFDVKGILKVENLTIGQLNDAPMNTLMDECGKEEKAKITGLKSFPTIDFNEESFKVKMLNGKLLENIEFQNDLKDYTGLHLSNVTKLEVVGDLNFTSVFGVNWQDLMENVVFKNKRKTVPGVTTISGQVTADYIVIDYLNGLKYSHDYVVKSDLLEADVTGIKTFDSILVSELVNVQFINGIDTDEFIYLHEDQNLTNQITFENLIIEENLQIDGKIIGLPDEDIDPELNLLNSNIVQSNIKLSNLHVTGKVYVENLVNGSSWSELDDLILNDEENVTVSGTKVFLDRVHIVGGLELQSEMINDHHVSDFITLDTEQVLPNLSKMSGNINFEKVSYEELINFEKKINSSVDESGSSQYMKKVMIFSEPPLIDDFSASYINENIAGTEFSEKLNSLLKNVHFDHLKVKNLIVEDLEPVFVNNVNYQKFKNKKISKTGFQSISGNVSIKYLELEKLYADYVNGRTTEEIEDTINKINTLYDSVFNGNAVVESLNVNGTVVTRIINDRDLYYDFGVNRIDKLILKINATIENVLVDGLVNGLNFTEKSGDCVLKNEDNVMISGRKKIKKLKARNLQVKFVNGHLVDDMISLRKNQTLNGPIKIKGSVKVLNNFNATHTVNNMPYHNIHGAVRKLNDKVYKLTGDFIVQDRINIKDLNVFGFVQDEDMEEFLQNLIYLNEKEVVVVGTKVFNDSIKFGNGVTVTKNLNEIDLETFYNNVVLIDRPISLKSSVIFMNDIFVKNDLRASSIRANAINNVNLDELMGNVVYLNRPTSIVENLTLSNVEFRSDIFVESWNGVVMDTVITLHTDQMIPGTLMCMNATVKDMEIGGFVNDEKMTEMYSNTFMLSGDQHITGKLIFMNNVYAKSDFNSQYINNADMTNVVSLSDVGPMIGNFVFNHPVVMNGDLIVHGKVNGIDISKWHSTTIKSRSSSKQIIYGNLTVHGNVHFEQDVSSSGSLNGIGIRKLAYDIEVEKKKAADYVSIKKKDLKSKYERLNKLKDSINDAVYKFKSFEYLQILEFDQKIVSVCHFEFNSVDYIAVNFETCYLNVYAYTNKGFESASEIYDFGIVKRYITLSYGNDLYFVTLGKPECGRNSGNIWVLRNHQFEHVFDLKNVTDIQELGNDGFAIVIDEQVEEWSVKDIHQKRFEPVHVIPIDNGHVQFFLNENNTFLASRESIYGLNVSGNSELLEFEEYENPFDTNDILSFRAGIYQKEFLLYYDERISNDYIFICNNNLARRKILQIISAKKPNSLMILNFEGSYETLFVFAENKRKIQVYEYKGIEGFKYHSSIKMKLDRFYNFKLRMHPYFVKKHCLAVVQEKKLSILIAKMYGDKLDTSKQLFFDDV